MSLSGIAAALKTLRTFSSTTCSRSKISPFQQRAPTHLDKIKNSDAAPEEGPAEEEGMPADVRFTRTFTPGQTYSPRDINEESTAKWKLIKSFEKREDPFRKLRIDPLKEYKNPHLLAPFMSETGRMMPKSLTHLSATSQRKVFKAIKRARHMGLIPFEHKPILTRRGGNPARMFGKAY